MSPILQVFPVEVFGIFAKQFLSVAQFFSHFNKDTEIIKDGVEFLDDVKIYQVTILIKCLKRVRKQKIRLEGQLL